MTSNNNQEFVKAFSRRGRRAEVQPLAASLPAQPVEAPSQTGGVNIGSDPQITRVDPPQSVVSSAQASRNNHQDVAAQIGTQQRATSLQHIHTAYAAPPIAPAATPPAVEPADTAHDIASDRIDQKSHNPSGPHYPSHSTDEPARPDRTRSRQIEPFQAVWEVDVFDVPGSVADLFFDGKRHQQIAERMSAAVKSGLQSVLVTSVQSGEGRSSVAIGIAMAAAASGIRVALVDADTKNPTLADDLRLDLQYGWIDTVRGGLPIKEIAVYAVEDGVTLIPLMPPQGQTAATPYEVTRLVDTLQDHFDLLIVDGPTTESNDTIKLASAFDAAVIVRDAKRNGEHVVNETANQLQAAGVQGVGVVDNFV